MDVGNQIRKYRKGMDYSQADLAEKIYVSSQTISNWENERSYPDLHNLIALSVLFNVSLDELVKGDVVEMRNVIDQSSMSKYSWMMLIFMVLGSISIGPVLKYLGDWGLIITFGLMLIGLYYAMKIEKLKTKYNVKTYEEIVKFLDHGTEGNPQARDRTKDIIQMCIIVIAFVVITVILAQTSLNLFQ
ncbi:helix-turn-helix domain-containing protein [Macrococcoides caseolyticum]|uniref:helix-turn-helix domain-containing protein n=1 Tax=Macrococcoides caseolyticum TaxID=69966 RepID=UPI001F36B8D9|nr:helix-turn-helix domain-containing protein [Macrococcus caseolyticus]MCE4956615.1 helix-turn-helix domain-containing protein [Macrococcus caseolyticus]